MEPSHDRMPAILDRADEVLWLDPAVRRPELVLPLLRPYPKEAMATRAVPTLVNDVRNEGPI
jgi:putative SOS response-associated peptidase YedK